MLNPAASKSSTSLTLIRIPLTQGRPPHCFELNVIRSSSASIKPKYTSDWVKTSRQGDCYPCSPQRAGIQDARVAFSGGLQGAAAGDNARFPEARPADGKPRETLKPASTRLLLRQSGKVRVFFEFNEELPPPCRLRILLLLRPSPHDKIIM